MQAKHRKDLSNSLFKNSLTFLHQACKLATAKHDPHQNAIFSCIHAAIGLELLVKTRLSKEHWTLVFESPERAPLLPKDLEESKTIGCKTATERLSRFCRSSLKDDHLKSINKLSEIRNKAVHCTIEMNQDHAKSLIGRSLDIALLMIDNDLKIFSRFYAADVAELRSLASGIDGFINERLRKISKEIEKNQHRHASHVDTKPRLLPRTG